MQASHCQCYKAESISHCKCPMHMKICAWSLLQTMVSLLGEVKLPKALPAPRTPAETPTTAVLRSTLRSGGSWRVGTSSVPESLSYFGPRPSSCLAACMVSQVPSRIGCPRSCLTRRSAYAFNVSTKEIIPMGHSKILRLHGLPTAHFRHPQIRL